MRVCLVYDCLFPYTVGGGERWFRSLAERLVADGHTVTYLTLRQWDQEPEIPGVRVIAVGPRLELYVGGRRRVTPTLRFGVGVLRHLLRHGRDYDVVHTAAFPYFSLLAAAVARPLGRYDLLTEWFEVWSRTYWQQYLGRAGWVGIAVQRACARVPQRAFAFSQMHAERLREEGLRGTVTVHRGAYTGPLEPHEPLEPDAVVVFAARHIPEKRAPVVVDAVGLAARSVPGLHGVIYGDGPERAEVLRRIAALPDPTIVTAPGFAAAAELEAALRRAVVMVLPSSREGYGMIVVEAAACDTPSIVVDEPDNAAVELIEQGVNGLIAASASAEDLAAAIVEVCHRGTAMRASTRAWFTSNASRISAERSFDQVLEAYREPNARS